MDRQVDLQFGESVTVTGVGGPTKAHVERIEHQLSVVRANYESHLETCRDRFEQLEAVTSEREDWRRRAKNLEREVDQLLDTIEEQDEDMERLNAALEAAASWEARFQRQVLRREQADEKVGALEQAVDKWRNDWTEQRNVAASAAARVTELADQLLEVEYERDQLRQALIVADQNYADLQRMVGEALSTHPHFRPPLEEAPF